MTVRFQVANGHPPPKNQVGPSGLLNNLEATKTVLSHVYRCRVLPGGSHTASTFLRPLFSQWSDAHGFALAAGTLNLCADWPLTLPETYTSLSQWNDYVLPPERRRPELDPRLYRARLNGLQPVWLFRWSRPEHLRCFVGEADGCAPECRCEIVATVHLRGALGLTDGDAVDLDLLN